MNTTTGYKMVISHGISFEWLIAEPLINCKLSAPTTGWVAVGFNTRDEMAETNLIMGCIENSRLKIQDRFIVRSGLHLSKTELGSTDNLSCRKGVEIEGETILEFALPLIAPDRFSYDLVEGRDYYLLLAYSLEKDFNHHSAYRTSLGIIL